MKTNRKISILSPLLFVLVGSSIIFTTSAHAAPPCDRDAYCCGSSCEDLDPQGTNCTWGAGHYGYKAIPSSKDPTDSVGSIELIYSPKCQANWARIQTKKDATVRARVVHEQPKGSGFWHVHGEVRKRATRATLHYVWSNMTDGNRPNAAFGEVYTDDGDSGVEQTAEY